MSENGQGVVFVSHVSSHVKEVEVIVNFLEENGAECWYAPRDIPKSTAYYEKIQESIEHHASVMLVYVTEDIQESKFVKKEINAAINYDVPILLVMPKLCGIPKNIEFLVQDQQWIDLEKEGLGAVMQGVEDALGVKSEKKKQETD